MTPASAREAPALSAVERLPCNALALVLSFAGLKAGASGPGRVAAAKADTQVEHSEGMPRGLGSVDNDCGKPPGRPRFRHHGVEMSFPGANQKSAQLGDFEAPVWRRCSSGSMEDHEKWRDPRSGGENKSNSDSALLETLVLLASDGSEDACVRRERAVREKATCGEKNGETIRTGEGRRRGRGKKKTEKRKGQPQATPFSPQQAALLSSLICEWLHDENLPSSAVVASFVLAALALKYGRSWAVGAIRRRRTANIGGVPSSGADLTRDSPLGIPAPSSSLFSSASPGITVGAVPGLCEILTPHPRKILEWCDTQVGSLSCVPLRRIFEMCRLCHQKPCVRAAVLGWLDGMRPIVLLHRIPSPMEVLGMQAVGKRVCTLFREASELQSLHVSELAYLDNDQGTVHARDALEFLTHDLSHIERFWGDTFEEQVGFFGAMRDLDPTGQGRPWRFFRLFHSGSEMRELWPRLQYVFSDMNCWATHLMGYLKAKWRLLGAQGAGGFEAGWTRLMDDVGLDGDARKAAQMLCGGDSDAEMTPALGESLRDFFKKRGRQRLRQGLS